MDFPTNLPNQSNPYGRSGHCSLPHTPLVRPKIGNHTPHFCGASAGGAPINLVIKLPWFSLSFHNSV